MGFTSSFKSLIHGDVSGAANLIFIPETEIARGEALSDALSRDVAAKQASGLYTADEAQARLARLETNRIDQLIRNPEYSPVTGFGEGWKQGATNIRDTASGALNAAIGTVTSLVPWQVWAVLLVGVAIWGYPYYKASIGVGGYITRKAVKR